MTTYSSVLFTPRSGEAFRARGAEIAGFSLWSDGSFPRARGTHVRERQPLTLEAAVQRMTALPAPGVGIRDRGTLAVGQRADITVFNAEQIADRASYTAPHHCPEGI